MTRAPARQPAQCWPCHGLTRSWCGAAGKLLAQFSSWVYPFYRFSQPACDFELTPGVLVSSWRWQEPFPLHQLSQTGAVGAFVPGACSGCVDTVPGDRVQGAVPRALAACLLGTCLCLGSFSFGLWVSLPSSPPTPHGAGKAPAPGDGPGSLRGLWGCAGTPRVGGSTQHPSRYLLAHHSLPGRQEGARWFSCSCSA